MFDRGSDSGYDYGDPYGDPYGGYGGEPQGGGGMQMPDFSGVKAPSVDIKKFMPLIVIGVILLVIGGAVMFYLGSQHTITFNIMEKDGGNIYARLEIEAPDGTSVFRQSNTQSEQVTLGAGEYDLKVSKSGYAPYTKTINVPEDTSGGNYSIELYKDLDADLVISIEEGVDSIYGTRMISGEIEIQNKEKEIKQEELIASSADLKVLFPGDSLNNWAVSVSPQASTTVKFQIGMKTAPSSEEDVEVRFYIKGAEISKTLKLNSNPTPEIAVTFRKNTEDIKAGDNEANIFDLKIKNNSRFPARDIVIDIVPNAGFEKYLSWFEFNDYDVNKYSYIIENMGGKGDPDEEIKPVLYVKVPADVTIGTEFKGSLVVSSVTFEKSQIIDLYYTVSDAVVAGIEVDLGNDPITVKETKDLTFEISNSGEFDIEDVELKVVNFSECDASWFEFLDDDDGDYVVNTGLLKEKNDPNDGDVEEFDVRLLPGFPGTDRVDCKIQWSYTDPITGDLVVDDEIYTIIYDRPDED